MQIKKSISVVFILLTFLSLTGSFSQDDFNQSADPFETETLLVEDSDNILHEFRETVKLNVVGGSKPSERKLLCSLPVSSDTKDEQRIHDHHQQFISSLSEKLFIDFGILIIYESRPLFPAGLLQFGNRFQIQIN